MMTRTQTLVEAAVTIRGELAGQVIVHTGRGFQPAPAQPAWFTHRHRLARPVGRTEVR